MNQTILKTSVLCCIVTTALFAGCGKKTVSPELVEDGRKPEGRLIGGAATPLENEDDGNYAEGGLESLDTTGTPFPPDNTSDEYKQRYGRSTAPLLPVYFAFDSSSIDSDQLENLNTDGRYILDNGSARVVLEGNCDQRGTADYNLALGELRAKNVKKYLINLGVEPARMTTVSYGSERPLFLGSDESSWAGNRRVDLVLP